MRLFVVLLTICCLGCGATANSPHGVPPAAPAQGERTDGGVRYRVVDVGVLDGWLWSVATGIADGQLVGIGTRGFGSVPFRWDGALHPVLPSDVLLGVTGAWARGVNANGEVVGAFSPVDLGSPIHAFASSGGTFTDLGSLSDQASVAAAVNAEGLIVGYSWTSPDLSHVHAFAWRAGTGMRDLGTLEPCPDSEAVGVNEAGQAVGVACGWTRGRPVLFECGRVVDLGTLGGPSGWASGINSIGHVVGAADLAAPPGMTHGFVWERGRMIDVGALPGGSYSALANINSSGVAVGTATDTVGQSHAVVYRDGTLTDLDSLLDTQGWTLRDAVDIDDAGRIAANARAQGGVHAVLLVPQPPVP